MKKITVSVDEDTYRNASARAAELGTSVSDPMRREQFEHAVRAAGAVEARLR